MGKKTKKVIELNSIRLFPQKIITTILDLLKLNFAVFDKRSEGIVGIK
jgi:hypothetical protein